MVSWCATLPLPSACMQTHLDFDRAEVLRDLVRLRLGLGRESGGLFLLFDTEGGLRAREVVALELAEKSKDLVVGKQGRALIQDLRAPGG